MGQEFQFLIYFVRLDINTGISTSTKLKYPDSLQKWLKCGHKVYKVLIDEYRFMLREYISARRPDPFICEIGDYIWVRRQIKSNEKRELLENYDSNILVHGKLYVSYRAVRII